MIFHDSSSANNASPLNDGPVINKPQTEASTALSSKVSSSGTNNGSSTSLTVNGQNIELPANGSLNKTVVSDGQVTDISVQHSSTGGSGSNTNSTSVNVYSNSTN